MGLRILPTGLGFKVSQNAPFYTTSKSSDRLYNIFKKQSKNKKRIDDIRKELINPKYNILKSESKVIKRNLYNIEKQRKISSKKTSKYIDELDKRILRLDKYHDYDDFEYKGIKDIENLFKISIDKDYYKPKLNKSGYNKNYAQYQSKGDKILSLKEYLNLIEKYLRELLEEYKQKGEWKVQLTIEVNFISKPCENHDYCHVEMPTKNNNIIKHNHGEKSMKLPFVIYTDLECLLEKMSTCINNPNKSSTTKINKVKIV